MGRGVGVGEDLEEGEAGVVGGACSGGLMLEGVVDVWAVFQKHHLIVSEETLSRNGERRCCLYPKHSYMELFMGLVWKVWIFLERQERRYLDMGLIVLKF